mmetsp:Transcript_29191/g.69161  ORF Transcript_29191/g.69161 Transcript_29191/m.69161 type:complete len:319 (+) Transcript_29191:74-1030(+)
MDLALSPASSTLWHDEHTAASDGDDHTFNGVMFDVDCRSELPVDTLYLRSVSVRGQLGEVSVYTKEGTYYEDFERKHAWTRIYCAFHEPSPMRLVKLEFQSPIAIQAGGTAALYIHSTLVWDGMGMAAIVYNNQRHRATIENRFMTVSPALAHTASEAFSRSGFWGMAWRPRREFVGSIDYAVRWRLWTPENSRHFNPQFREAVRTLLLVHRFGKSGIASLSPDMLFYIFNFLRHDAFGEETVPDAASEVAPSAAVPEQGLARRRLVRDSFGSFVVDEAESEDEAEEGDSFMDESDEAEEDAESRSRSEDRDYFNYFP